MNTCSFLDTKIINNKNNITTEVVGKTSKLPVHLLFRVSKWYKRNALIGDLHRSKRLSSNFEMEIKVIKRKFWNADFPLKFFKYSYIIFSLLKMTIRLLFYLIFLKRVNYLFWLKYCIVMKPKMLPNILLIISRSLPITVIEFQFNR